MRSFFRVYSGDRNHTVFCLTYIHFTLCFQFNHFAPLYFMYMLYLENWAHYSANKLSLLPVFIAATDQESRSCDSSKYVKCKTADRSIYSVCGDENWPMEQSTVEAWYGWFFGEWIKLKEIKPTNELINLIYRVFVMFRDKFCSIYRTNYNRSMIQQ